MIKSSTWTHIESFKTLPCADFIHCDTRDFHILCIDHDKPKDSDLQSLISRATDENKFNRSEILGLLTMLESASGGKRPWRVLHLKNKTMLGWLKYIRFVKTKETVDLGTRQEPVYIAYHESKNNYTLLSRQDFREENMKTD